MVSTVSDYVKCPHCGLEENVGYFSSDLSRFVCGNCARQCELSDETRVLYGDIPIPFCSDECEAEWLSREELTASKETSRVELVVGTVDDPLQTEQIVPDPVLFKCSTCGAALPNGAKHVWQGRKHFCQRCFWSEGTEDATTKVVPSSGAPDKENTHVDH